MPRPAAVPSLDNTVRLAVDAVVVRASSVIVRAIAKMVAEQLERELTKTVPTRRGSAKRGPARSSRVALSQWVADRRARRVPTFVIDMTGLDTKKKIVARFGANAAFEKGKPLPKVAKAA